MKLSAHYLLLIKWKFRRDLYMANYSRTATLVGSEQSGKYKDDGGGGRAKKLRGIKEFWTGRLFNTHFRRLLDYLDAPYVHRRHKLHCHTYILN
jgi:hypothetical protein